MLLILFNLFFYGKIKVENNKIENYLKEAKKTKVEKSLDKELLDNIKILKEIIKDENILNLNIERDDFEIEIYKDYKNLIIYNINKIGGKIEDINLDEYNNTYILKGEFM